MKDLLELKMLEREFELGIIEKRINEMVNDAKAKVEESYFKAVKGFRLLGVEDFGYREPPKFKPVFPLFPATVADWNFSDVNWSLNTSTYVSPPSSLQFAVTIGVYRHNLCKAAGTTALNQGRLVSQIRSSFYARIVLFLIFRNQTAVGSASMDNCYYVGIYSGGVDATTAKIVARVAAADNVIITKGLVPNLAYSVFHRVRVTWWEEGGILLVRLENYSAGAWSNLITDTSDANNRWSGAATNRVGLGVTVNHLATDDLFDDAEIWG